MDDDVKVLQRIYDLFNARDIDGVLTALTDDVAWANGMDGGHVHGREAVRAYWTRQWAMVNPHVEPVGFHRTADGAIVEEVRQSVRDLEGKPLEGQTHGLKDKTVGHVFRLREGKVDRFGIKEAAQVSSHSPSGATSAKPHARRARFEPDQARILDRRLPVFDRLAVDGIADQATKAATLGYSAMNARSQRSSAGPISVCSNRPRQTTLPPSRERTGRLSRP
jgi:ketosteroid isomerase-like protein